MKAITLFVSLITIGINLQAQTFSGFKYLSGVGGGAGAANGIASDVDGNFFIAGEFENVIDADPGEGTHILTSNGYYDAFIAKFNSSGELVWAKSMGEEDDDRAYSIEVDQEGNIYTLGYFQGTMDFDPGAGIFNMTAGGTSDLFLAKLDKDGNFIWAKQIRGVSSGPTVGASIRRNRTLIIDSLSNPIIVGSFYGTTDLDPSASVHTLTATGFMDVFILKLNSEGDYQWAKQLGGTGLADGYSGAADKDNNVYIAGLFQGTVDFDPGNNSFEMTADGIGSSGNEGYLVKLDASGNLVWAKQMGGISEVMVLDPSGNNVYVSGIFVETVDVNPGTDVFTLTAKNADVFTTKLTAEGNFVWSKQIKGTLSSSTFTYDLGVDYNSNVYILGMANSTVDFDPGTEIYNSTGSFISKLNSDGNFVYVNSYDTWIYVKMEIHKSGKFYLAGSNGRIFISGDFPIVNNVLQSQSFKNSIYPNPAIDKVTIEISGSDQEEMEIAIFNSLGVLVKKNYLSGYVNSMSIEDLADGIYFYQILSKGTSIHEGKIVVRK